MPLKHFTFHAYCKNTYVANRKVMCVSILVPCESLAVAWEKVVGICNACMFEVTSIAKAPDDSRTYSYVPPHYLATITNGMEPKRADIPEGATL